MTYPSHAVYEDFVTGQWWFAANDPIDFGSAAVEPDAPYEDVDEDPEPAPYWNGIPRCRICKDPNFSLEDDRCIVCRIIN